MAGALDQRRCSLAMLQRSLNRNAMLGLRGVIAKDDKSAFDDRKSSDDNKAKKLKALKQNEY